MEEFWIEIRGRLVRIVLEDVRAPDGSVPTLICRAAPLVRVLPVHVESSAGSGFPGGFFPGMPTGLRAEHAAVAGAVEQIHLDVSQLPAGIVSFSLEQFAEHTLEALAAGSTSLRLSPAVAAEWGAEVHVRESGGGSG